MSQKKLYAHPFLVGLGLILFLGSSKPSEACRCCSMPENHPDARYSCCYDDSWQKHTNCRDQTGWSHYQKDLNGCDDLGECNKD